MKYLTLAFCVVSGASCANDGGAFEAAAARRSDVAVAVARDAGAESESETETESEIESESETESESESEMESETETEVAEFPPPPAAPPLSQAALTAIRAELEDALADPALAGKSFGGFVLDLETGAIVYAGEADRLLIPASNTKVFTTAAALALLGPDHRMLSRIFIEGTLGANGTLTGNLHLHSEHDFTWSRWFYADARFPLDRMVDTLWRAGLRKVTGHLDVWGAYLYDGHHYGTYDPATQRTRAASAFRAALTARGITVSGADVDHASMALPPGTEAARWESIPLWVGCWPILRKSHNEMADVLLRHLGYVLGGSSEYAAGATAVMDWLASGADPIPTTGLLLFDGSGLDVRNRVSARQLVAVYRRMLASAAGARWKTALSVGGAEGPSSTDASDDVAIVTTHSGPYNGTLAYRMTDADTAGRVFGKSGINAGITTSGVLVHRHDGRRYAFAFEMNDLPDGAYGAARAAQDAMVVAIAGDNLGLGTRPVAPVLACVRGLGADRVAVSWGAVAGVGAGASGYVVWTSADGLAWDPADRKFVHATDVTLPVPAGTTLFVRVTALTPAGESEPSDTYAARPLDASRRALIVDADDRWQHQPTNENVMGAAHEFVGEYARALPAHIPFDTCANEQVLAHELGAWDTVIWAAGEESATDESFGAPEEAAIAAYLGSGGNLFVSGAEVAWDLDPDGNSAATAADTTFAETWLHARYAADDAGVYVVEPTPEGLFANLPSATRTLGFWTPGAMFVAYPDVLVPTAGASASLTYVGPGTVAAVQYAGDYAVVDLGFPFEAIDGAPARAAVMGAVMAFFGW